MIRSTCIFLLLPIATSAAGINGHVVGVHDGDTVTVLDASKTQHKIRLAGIDAPELKQAFGQKSKQHLSNLVFDKDVVLDCGKTDKYKREVCVVNIDGQDGNLAQVAAGLAWWYRAYAKRPKGLPTRPLKPPHENRGQDCGEMLTPCHRGNRGDTDDPELPRVHGNEQPATNGDTAAFRGPLLPKYFWPRVYWSCT